MFILLSIGLLLWPLSLIGNVMNNPDWTNNLWMVQYYADYFDKNYRLPLVFNTSNNITSVADIGIAYPQYYGYIYYQIMGLITFACSNVKLCYFLTSSILIALIMSSIIDICSWTKKERYFAIVAFVIVSNTYLFTDVFSRGAVVEYYAILLLYFTVVYFLRIITVDENQNEYLRDISFFFLGWMIMVGTHPITAVYGSVIIFMLMLVNVRLLKKISRECSFSIGVFVSFSIVSAILAVSPWFYLVIRNVSQLKISSSIHALQLYHERFSYLGSNFLTRFIGFPFDPHSLLYDLNKVSTSNMDTQVNLPMLLLYIGTIAYLIYIARKQHVKVGETVNINLLVIVFAIVFGIVISVSHPTMWISRILDKLFGSAQFAYRFITYFDISLMIGTVYNLWYISKMERIWNTDYFKILFAICITLSVHNLCISYTHTLANMKEVPHFAVESFHMPPTFFASAYAYESRLFPELKESIDVTQVNIPVAKDTLQAGEITFTLERDGIVKTNVAASQYNEILLDDERIPAEQLYNSISKDTQLGTLAFFTKKGTHTIRYRCDMPKTFTILRSMSYVVFFLLVFACIEKQIACFRER